MFAAGDPLPSCSDHYPELLWDLVENVAADQGECTCDCIYGSEAVCDTSATIQGFEDPDCETPTGAPQVIPAYPTACHALEVDAEYLRLVIPHYRACEATIEARMLPPVVDQRLRVCSGSATACPGGTCQGSTPGAACVFREGVHECEASSPWTTRLVAFQTVADGRTCAGACECHQGSCFADLYPNDTAECISDRENYYAGNCFPRGANAYLDVDTSANVEYYCPVTRDTVQPSGEVQLQDAITLCCAP